MVWTAIFIFIWDLIYNLFFYIIMKFYIIINDGWILKYAKDVKFGGDGLLHLPCESLIFGWALSSIWLLNPTI